MQYETKEITPKMYGAVGKLPIKNQDKILATMKEPLDLVQGLKIIKSESNNYTQANDKAEQADALMMKLLAKRGFKFPAPKDEDSKPTMTDKEKYNSWLKGIEVSLKYEEQKEKVAALTALKNGYLTLLKYA